MHAMQQLCQPARSRRPELNGSNGSQSVPLTRFSIFQNYENSRAQNEKYKIYSKKKEVNGQTNKASRTRPHACPALAACRVACCPLPACSASPFATLSAARIGYVECPFNGLNTHTVTRTESASHPFTNLLELALVFRAV